LALLAARPGSLHACTHVRHKDRCRCRIIGPSPNTRGAWHALAAYAAKLPDPVDSSAAAGKTEEPKKQRLAGGGPL
jgi:hypothetical protein